MVHNEVFRWIQLLAREDYSALSEVAEGELADARELEVAFAPYWDDFTSVSVDPEARSGRWFVPGDRATDTWAVQQIVLDPEGFAEWRLVGEVDLAASREAGEAVVRLRDIVRL